ncbi:uncharacterized protein EURHEDRAFT_217815 [Aspergillus ruber CBS 135680]|uniref:Secreted protein n=1 Tax=Aspergillus ruber (strain CBS 135680) TaxID=1388766 RepID=A0A017SQR6_ASPRC|nr:uncharacterized protein EURHEDRAFT_217815 [Aspergillus ruber CBS 135680]EYE98585.1 hypothetical protein EURHEDRAFT_217815 [Aspergillus ruber CBS 135680]
MRVWAKSIQFALAARLLLLLCQNLRGSRTGRSQYHKADCRKIHPCHQILLILKHSGFHPPKDIFMDSGYCPAPSNSPHKWRRRVTLFI